MRDARILVLRGGAIGDFILTVPVLTALRCRWPNGHLELIGYPAVTRLARACDLVDRTLSLDRSDMARFFSLRPDISGEQAAYIRGFDVVLSYLYDPSDAVRRNLLSAGARQVIYASPIVKDRHAADHLLRPLAELAIYPDVRPCARLALRAEHLARGRRRVRTLGSRVVILHPGSGSPRKNWPLERFLELAARIQLTGMTCVLALGDAENEIEQTLRTRQPAIPLVAGYSLVDLAGMLSACAAYVGNDSGITHLAAALGVPTVAVFGPTDPLLWAPRGRQVRLVRAGCGESALQTLSADRVMAAFMELRAGGA